MQDSRLLTALRGLVCAREQAGGGRGPERCGGLQLPTSAALGLVRIRNRNTRLTACVQRVWRR